MSNSPLLFLHLTVFGRESGVPFSCINDIRRHFWQKNKSVPVFLFFSFFWEADDEFDARAEYLFDRNIEAIFALDVIWALGNVVVRKVDGKVKRGQIYFSSY